MAVYKLDIQKVNQGVYWTNVWHVNAASLTEAINVGESLAEIEAALLPEYVSIDKIVATTMPSGAFVSETVAIVGTRTQGSGDEPLPMFNRYQINLIPDAGYHGKKFLALLREPDQNNGNLTAGAITYITTNVLAPLGELPICSPSGTPYTTVAVGQRVAMRQLRRARKRTTPVLP